MKLLKFFLGMMLGIAVISGVAASIRPSSPVPQSWAVANGTNAFGLDENAKPYVTIGGTNYSAITTNITPTNVVLVIKNGLVVGIQ